MSASEPRRNDLPAIQGIGPAMRQRLTRAEICTYAELAGIGPGELRRILGDLSEGAGPGTAPKRRGRDSMRKRH